MEKRNIVISELLPDFEYFKNVQQKDTIILHHTVSSVGKYIDDWFKADKGKSKVAVAYVVDKDGTVFELFNPKYWAWHTGTGNKNNIDKRSIGIEIVNEGILKKKNDKYYWFDGKYKYKGKVFTTAKRWRRYKYFASYTNEQVDSTLWLLEYLFQKFKKIPKQFSNTLDFNKKYFYTNGVITHVNIRKDKTDLSPAFPLKKVNEFLLKLNNKDIEQKRIYEFGRIPFSSFLLEHYMRTSAERYLS